MGVEIRSSEAAAADIPQMSKSKNQSLQIVTDNFIKKETLTQVFPCAFCKISKNRFFTEHLRTTASEILVKNFIFKVKLQASNVEIYQKNPFTISFQSFCQNLLNSCFEEHLSVTASDGYYFDYLSIMRLRPKSMRPKSKTS